MFQNIRVPIYLMAILLTLVPSISSFFVMKEVLHSHNNNSVTAMVPQISKEMAKSSERLKNLARIDPKNQDLYRSEFNQLDDLRQKMLLIFDLSPIYARSYASAFIVLLAVSLVIAIILSWWLNQYIVNTHEAAIRRLQKLQEKNDYLENRESWNLIAQKFVHEIKNPLTPVKVMVGRLQNRYKIAHKEISQDFDNTLQDTKNIVFEELDKVNRWVSSFSQYARLPEAKLESIDLSEFLRSSFQQYREIWPAVDFVFLESPHFQGVIIVSLDEGLFKQVIFNLVKNSMEAFEVNNHSNTGCAERLVISVGNEWMIDKDSVSFTISDNGPGIPSSLREGVFRPYTSGATTKENMGLGLAICKRIMKEHSGNIVLLDSHHGAVFRITLPRLVLNT